MKKCITLTAFLLSFINLSAQGFLNTLTNTKIPPSPNAASIQKFGNIPVSHSTGIPEISIPLYNYDVGEFQFPISLAYHAGGVKVEETASNVGIGWALQAASVISRTVRGTYDELVLGGFINSATLPQSEFSGNTPIDVGDRPFTKIARNLLDSQNDIFTFSIGGTSGTFYLGKNNDILIAPQRRLKIEKRLSNINGIQLISGFDITDEHGVKYIFNAYEVTTHINGQSNNTFTSSWYLTEVVASNGIDKIQLQYSDINIDRFPLGRSFTERRDAYTGGGLVASSNFIEQILKTKRLENISFPDGVSVSFVYNTVLRTDFKDYALNQIDIKDSYGNQRGYLLSQDYSLNRLTLKTVTPYGGSPSNTTKPYTFSYEGPLPDRTSFQQDHWGFYNTNGGGLIPAETYSIGGTNLLLAGGNRKVDIMRCKAGSLNKITYPTGGYTVFELGPNIVKNSFESGESYAGGLRANRILDYDGVSAEAVQIKEYEYLLEDGTSSGNLGVYPVYSYAVHYETADPSTVVQHYYQGGSPNYLVRASSPVDNLSQVNGSPVSYSRVVEKLKGKGGLDMGKTVRNFTAMSPIVYSYFPNIPVSVKSWTSGLLINEVKYNSQDRPVNKIENQYSYVDDYYYQDYTRRENFRNLSIAPVKFRSSGSVVNVGGEAVYYLMQEFLPEAGRTLLLRQKTTNYDSHGNVTSSETKSFQYDNNFFYKKMDTLINSRDEKIITSYEYVPDRVSSGQDPNGVYSAMQSKNILNTVLKQNVKIGSTDISMAKVDYFKPTNSSIYLPSTIIKQNGTGPAVTIKQFLTYTTAGKPLEVKELSEAITSYIWGYKGQYPIAEAKNAPVSDIAFTGFEEGDTGGWSWTGQVISSANSAYDGLSYLGLSSGQSISKTGLNASKKYRVSVWLLGSASPAGYEVVARKGGWINCEKVVSGITTFTLTAAEVANNMVDNISICPVDARMTTYTYKPLVGMTSKRDERGLTEYYEYDNFGRLMMIRDFDGNILKDYRYHYKP